jgi:hypothetical protein
VISEPNKADGSCNAIFPELRHIPKKNKDLVLTHSDTHGARHPLVQARGVRREEGHALRRGRRLRLELLLEGLGRAPQLRLQRDDCRYALGDTRKHRTNGAWSDGVPITPLKIQDAAPIRP